MNPQPDAAVAILHARSPEESILLIRRSERLDDPWSGHWSFPGGRRDPQDRDLLDTALRELAEECGIRLPRQSMEAVLPITTAGRGAGLHLTVAPFVFRVSEPLPTVLDPREAVEALWLPVSKLRDPARHSLQSIPGMPAAPQFPAMELSGMPLWGFTYRLLAEWLGVRMIK
jgi:8-oxo-dGTP pyrophosphatase MutT (NUDIX family)